MAADLWNRRMQNLTGFSAALMPYLQQVPGNINAPYVEGAGAVESASGGFGQRLNDDTAGQSGKANTVLDSIGAPSGQRESGGDPGGVLAGMGGMEGALMRASGAKFANAAAQLPKTASLEQLQAMKDLQNKAGEADAGFSSDILQVLQGLPAARAQLRQQSITNNLAYQKANLSQLKFDADQHYKAAMIAFKAGDQKRYNAELKLAQQKESRYVMAEQGYSPSGDLLPGYHIDPVNNLPMKDGWKIGKNGQPVKLKSPSSASSKPKPSVTDSPMRVRKSIAADLKGYWIGSGHNRRRPTYSEGFSYLYQKYNGYIGHGFTEKVLDAMIDDILRSQGIVAGHGVPPGGSTPSNGSAPPGLTG
jgi:hypothetical protein